jgi:hypothetical protein
MLRQAAQRSVDGLWRAVGDIIDQISPTEAGNYFTAAGSYYPLPPGKPIDIFVFEHSLALFVHHLLFHNFLMTHTHRRDVLSQFP